MQHSLSPEDAVSTEGAPMPMQPDQLALEDQRFMARALQLARRGLFTCDPNPRVGCVIVRKGRIVGEGWHRHAGEPHAEIHALSAAGDEARGATAYVTLEPCAHQGRTPPCADQLIAAGVGRVVAAIGDPNPKAAGGLAVLSRAGVDVAVGPCGGEARALNCGFLARLDRGRPWVRLKVAASIDGRTATAAGESQWITGPAARADVQRWRARSSAIVTGVGTVLADDPLLSVRIPGVARQPFPVVLDSCLQTPPAARILRRDRALVVAVRPAAPAVEAIRATGAEILSMPGAEDRVDLDALLDELARREVNEVLVEAGPTLCGAFLKAAVADELILYLAPSLIGDKGRGMFSVPGLERLESRTRLDFVDVRYVGHDLRIVATPRRLTAE